MARVKVLERCRVSPPPSSLPNKTLPLSFFDVLWLPTPSIHRLFFFPLSSDLHSLLPNLKHSLSLALHPFFPLAGTLSLSPGNPAIRYSDGDSIPLTVAESDSDFHRLASDQPKPVAELHPLVPDLPGSDGPDTSDLIALQVTHFPNAGICIGVCTRDVVGDGSSTTHFMKSWASICKSGGHGLDSVKLLPVHDRSLIPDPNGFKKLFMGQLENYKGLNPDSLGVLHRPDAVWATFLLSQAQINGLRQLAVAQRPVGGQEQPKLTDFSVAAAYVWACLTKSRDMDGSRSSSGSGSEWFGFRSGWRAQFDPAIPDTYFGNCIWLTIFETNGADFVVGTEAIARAINGLKDGVLKDAESLIPQVTSLVKEGLAILSVQGSPKLRVYETDFGWGRPSKVEMISIERTGAMSIAESRNGSGGREIGIALPKPEMDHFTSLFQHGLTPLFRFQVLEKKKL